MLGTHLTRVPYPTPLTPFTNLSFPRRCFGKLSEDVRKREEIHVVRSARLFERRVSRINYLSSTILSRNTALVRCRKRQAYLCKPMYLGACVLDLSKLVMIRHWYRAIKPAFDRPGSLLTLQMTDTGKQRTWFFP